jgi:hypothetical protein
MGLEPTSQCVKEALDIALKTQSCLVGWWPDVKPYPGDEHFDHNRLPVKFLRAVFDDLRASGSDYKCFLQLLPWSDGMFRIHMSLSASA